MNIGSLHIYKKSESVADFHSIEKTIITDINPVKKQGLYSYEIQVFEWYGETVYYVWIDAFWFGETDEKFETLREASNWIKTKIFNKTQN